MARNKWLMALSTSAIAFGLCLPLFGSSWFFLFSVGGFLAEPFLARVHLRYELADPADQAGAALPPARTTRERDIP
jgi:hypothetical protein